MRACEKKKAPPPPPKKNMNTHTHTCSPKNCLSVKLVKYVVEFRSIFLALATFELWICCGLRDVDL